MCYHTIKPILLYDSEIWGGRLPKNSDWNLLFKGYHTLQGDNSLKSVDRFDHMMFVCRFQASR